MTAPADVVTPKARRMHHAGTVLAIIAVVIFTVLLALLAVAVTIGGWRDLRTMLRALGERRRR